MDDKALIILGAVASILLAAILAFIFARLGKVLDNQVSQGTAIEVMKSQMINMTSRVDSLHEWRNKKQEETILELRATIEEHNSSKNRRAGD